MSALDETQLQRLRAKLEAQEAELGGEVDAVDAEQADMLSKGPHDQSEDLAEQGEQRIREAVRHAEKERDVQELRDIDHARRRMAAGTYGRCVDCGTDIPLARLEARPAAARCLPCQEKFERDHETGPRILPMQ